MHECLIFSYLGFELNGFARQEHHTKETVEGYLFSALEAAQLLPNEIQLEKYKKDLQNYCDEDPMARKRYEDPSHDRANAFAVKYHYARCGRTDKGVSAFGQVISILLRSKSTSSLKENHVSSSEMPFDLILNSFLPPFIRVLDWAAVSPSFSARFDCTSRTYKYIFSTKEFSSTALDIGKMQEGCKLFEGYHNFKNFCKVDSSKPVVKYERSIDFAMINPINDNVAEDPLYVLTLKGRGFLYHQVRCMMGVLFRIGRGIDPPSIILEYYKAESKPSYDMASEYPLILWDCAFDGPKDAYPGNLTPPIPITHWCRDGGEGGERKIERSFKLLEASFFKSIQDYLKKGRTAAFMFSYGLQSIK